MFKGRDAGYLGLNPKRAGYSVVLPLPPAPDNPGHLSTHLLNVLRWYSVQIREIKGELTISTQTSGMAPSQAAPNQHTEQVPVCCRAGPVARETSPHSPQPAWREGSEGGRCVMKTHDGSSGIRAHRCEVWHWLPSAGLRHSAAAGGQGRQETQLDSPSVTSLGHSHKVWGSPRAVWPLHISSPHGHGSLLRAYGPCLGPLGGSVGWRPGFCCRLRSWLRS